METYFWNKWKSNGVLDGYHQIRSLLLSTSKFRNGCFLFKESDKLKWFVNIICYSRQRDTFASNSTLPEWRHLSRCHAWSAFLFSTVPFPPPPVWLFLHDHSQGATEFQNLAFCAWKIYQIYQIWIFIFSDELVQYQKQCKHVNITINKLK